MLAGLKLLTYGAVKSRYRVRGLEKHSKIRWPFLTVVWVPLLLLISTSVVKPLILIH